MKHELERQIAENVRELFGVDAPIELTRPEEQFGDYSTNVALQLSKQLGKNPRQIGEELADRLRESLAEPVSEVSVAGPGFLNLRLRDQALLAAAETQPTQSLAGQQILVEFGDPNPFKAMHIGHLYSYIVGDAICYVLEAAGAEVKRLSYHGDVGLHVAKAIWGMQQASYDPATMTDPIKNNIGVYYAAGAQAYEADEAAKQAIDDINKQVYAQDPSIKSLYDEGKVRSFANFDLTLQEMHIKNDGHSNDGRYLESKSAPVGLETVKSNPDVFTESEGAIVFEGEKVGLHTRVFITGKGLPTYETKDLGLTELKKSDFPQAARSIIITANEQAEYFKVMLAALKEIDPELAGKTRHLTHGFVSLTSGKMSSRTGDVYSATDLIADVEATLKDLDRGQAEEIKIGAIKYAFTKHRLGGDLVYDLEESISLEGNSGPYLQYTHARARSILRQVNVIPTEAEESVQPNGSLDFARDDKVAFEDGERSLLRKIGEYSEVVDKSVAELMPHHIATYLYELAQTFNRFYEHNRVMGDERQQLRLALVQRYADTLRSGLNLLGITAPDKM